MGAPGPFGPHADDVVDGCCWFDLAAVDGVFDGVERWMLCDGVDGFAGVVKEPLDVDAVA